MVVHYICGYRWRYWYMYLVSHTYWYHNLDTGTSNFGHKWSFTACQSPL